MLTITNKGKAVLDGVTKANEREKVQAAVARLADYEGTGLMPEDVQMLIDEIRDAVKDMQGFMPEIRASFAVDKLYELGGLIGTVTPPMDRKRGAGSSWL